MSLGPAFLQLSRHAGNADLLLAQRGMLDNMLIREDIPKAAPHIEPMPMDAVSRFLASLSPRNKILAGTPEAEAVEAATALGANLHGAPLSSSVGYSPVDITPEDDVIGDISTTGIFRTNSFYDDFVKRNKIVAGTPAAEAVQAANANGANLHGAPLSSNLDLAPIELEPEDDIIANALAAAGVMNTAGLFNSNALLHNYGNRDDNLLKTLGESISADRD